jgi:hypothetical protein
MYLDTIILVQLDKITYSWLMYIDIVPNRSSPPAILLRESVREGSKVRKRTIANLSGLSIEQAEAMRDVLAGKRLASIDEAFEITRSQSHGAVEAVRTAMRRLGFDRLIDKATSRERDLVVAMIAGRIIAPSMRSMAPP